MARRGARARCAACRTLAAGVVLLGLVAASAESLGEGPRECGGAGNAVAWENCAFDGAPSSEWDVNGAGDPEIVGFATSMSYAPGEHVELKVRTVSDKYRVDVYRLGWYQGHGARLVGTSRPHVPLPQAQPPCLERNDTLLYDCGTWATSATWQVPQNATSGVYVARLTREDSLEPRPIGAAWRVDYSQVGLDAKFQRPGLDTEPGLGEEWPHSYGAHKRSQGAGRGLRNALREPRASHVYFVVRDLASRSAVLFQTSDTTWQAYNRFGGSSTYGSYKPAEPRRRCFESSYNRPFENRDYRTINIIFGAELPAIRFLERNGFDVSYFSSIDTHLYGGELLRNHDVFLSVGHDEYWSGQQRANVERARDSGVHLMFWSGNQVFWRVRWEPSPTEQSAQGGAGAGAGEQERSRRPKPEPRTMVCYKDTQESTKLDPHPHEWTGTFRDSRAINPLGAQPENSLSGLLFTVNAWRNDPLIVPRRFSRAPIWANTEVAALAAQPAFRAASEYTHLGTQPVYGSAALVEPWRVLKQGILGHEWDSDVNNGFRPAGLVRLSETLVDNVMHIQDSGSVYDTSSAVHHLVLHRARKCDARPPGEEAGECNAVETGGSSSVERCRCGAGDAARQGALVFGAGTVQWAWGLDPMHDNEHGLLSQDQNRYDTRVGFDLTGPDRDVQQVTINLFAMMGVVPSALEPGLSPGSPLPAEDAVSSGGKCHVEPGSRGQLRVRVDGVPPHQIVLGVEVQERTQGDARWHPAEHDLELYAGVFKKQGVAAGPIEDVDPAFGRRWVVQWPSPGVGEFWCRFSGGAIVLSAESGPFSVDPQSPPSSSTG